jgi:hypothetical protein
MTVSKDSCRLAEESNRRLAAMAPEAHLNAAALLREVMPRLADERQRALAEAMFEIRSVDTANRRAADRMSHPLLSFGPDRAPSGRVALASSRRSNARAQARGDQHLATAVLGRTRLRAASPRIPLNHAENGSRKPEMRPCLEDATPPPASISRPPHSTALPPLLGTCGGGFTSRRAPGTPAAPGSREPPYSGGTWLSTCVPW